MCWGIDQFFKNKYRGIKSLSQHFEKEIYQYVNISIANFLNTLSKCPSGTHPGGLPVW